MNFEQLKAWLLAHKALAAISLLALALLGSWLVQSQFSPSANIQSPVPAAKKSLAQRPAKSSKPYVTCDIAGAVKDQGVYTLKKGARIDDLIAAAGGLQAKAALKAINRSLLLKDQDKVYVPYQGEAEANNNASTIVNHSGQAASGSDAGENSGGNKIHLNSASKDDLQKLTGIGEKKAEQIISYREEKGGFKKIDEIKEVSGIGDKTFAGFKDQLAL